MIKSGRPKVLLGVTGGIAAYKSAEILRGLQRNGVDVSVVMTPAATQFVGPLTFETLSGHPVHLDAQWLRSDSGIAHVEEGREADLLLIAPATANTLAKMAQGIADNLLTTTYLAFSGTVLVAPAMNANMWSHPATQQNLSLLEKRGVVVVQPDEGELACGVYGAGRMAEPDGIVAEVKLRLQVESKSDLRGLRVLVTAGGTQEPIDAVRYIGNRSSGKMGFSLARAAHDRGAEVDLVHSNVKLPKVPGVRQVEASTADDVYREVMGRLPEVDVLIMAAAVADYRVSRNLDGKMAKQREPLTIQLEPTADVLCEVAALEGGRFVVGFAAEFGMEGLERARGKLERKNLDMIVFNDISRSDIGFNVDENEVVILMPEGEVEVARTGKEVVAERILDEVARALRRRRKAGVPV